MRDFTIRSNTNGFGLRLNTIKDLCPSFLTNWSLDGLVRHTVRQVISDSGHRFESLDPHCEGGIVRYFTIRYNTNGLNLLSNAIKDLCLLILHQLIVRWIGKAHGLTYDINCSWLLLQFLYITHIMINYLSFLHKLITFFFFYH